MNISILTVFPDLYTSFLQTSLVQRAQEKNLVNIDVESFFSFVRPKERIDAPTFGPGTGMLIRPKVIEKAVESKEKAYGSAYKIFFSPQGQKLNQKVLKKLAQQAQTKKHLMLVPSRYEGMDARVEAEYADALISIGDFVLMGGDLPAMILLEGLLRLVSGVVGKQESVEKESFSGVFVDYPAYTAPVIWHDKKVPDIVRSGNHGEIEAWRMEQAAKRTVEQHFNWLRSCKVSEKEKKIVRKFIPSHYVSLMHDDVLIGEERLPGTTSVTSIDIHDIARSSRTYGINAFFIVTPLIDQQKIVKRLLDFWKIGHGITYNQNRSEAVGHVQLSSNLDEVLVQIEEREGNKPLLVGTSARDYLHKRSITYYDQAVVWESKRPILIVFGTGRGLSDELIDRCDFVLRPAEGFSTFNHLSVRSAVAVVLDRWLGINVMEA